MKTPNFKEENDLRKNGYQKVAGIDEVGRGPLAGPVVACAVTIRRLNLHWRFGLQHVKDSKQLSAKQREKIYGVLTKHPDVEWGIGTVSERTIDRINILEATKLAMVRAIINLDSKKKTIEAKTIEASPRSKEAKPRRVDFLILDGNFGIASKVPQKSIIKADEKVFSCACASIIAKVTRDRLMRRYDKQYPFYGFARNKGYPTKFHRAMIQKHGPCAIHRQTFTLV